MNDKAPNDNNLQHPLEPTEPQGDRWDTISIAVRRDFKGRFVKAAKRVGLKPSQFGRMILHDGVARTEQAA